MLASLADHAVQALSVLGVVVFVPVAALMVLGLLLEPDVGPFILVAVALVAALAGAWWVVGVVVLVAALLMLFDWLILGDR